MKEIRARVIGAKLVVPALPTSVLVRQRLVDRLAQLLDDGSGSHFAVVTAPAGFGKTTLLAEFAIRAAEASRPVAWCSLDRGDSDSFRFWSAVMSALSLADENLATELAVIPAPRRSDSPDYLTSMLETLSDLPLVLVLENLHEITDVGVLADLDFLLAHLPSNVRVALTSRTDPPLAAVHAAKVSGTLTQLRAADLAFTADETRTWCRELSPDEGDVVWRRTEGWPAMVRLMEIALRSGNVDLDAAAWDSGMVDYLFHETFRRQSERIQRALMLLSVPDPISIDLAAELTGLSDAGEILERTAQRSGLIVRSARSTTGVVVYRMHPMLRAYLHSDLQRRDRDAERHAQQQTARWCLAAGFELDAVRHATASGDAEFQESTVRVAGPGLVNNGEAAILLDTLNLPGRRRGEEPAWTNLIRAAALLDDGQLNAAATELQRVGPQPVTDDTDHSGLSQLRQATEAHLMRRRGSYLDVAKDSPALGPQNPDLRLMLAIQRGSALVWQGDIDASEAELLRGIDIARGLGRAAALIDCLGFLAGVHSSRSTFDPMRVAAQEALDLCDAHGWADTPRAAYPHHLRAWAAYQDLDNDLARAHISLAESLVEPTADPTALLSIAGLSTALSYDMPVTDGPDTRAEKASSLHDVVVSMMPGRQMAPTLVTYAAVRDAQMAVHMQRLNRIPELVRLLRERFGACGEADLLQAVHKEAAGRRAEARALLTDLTRRPESLIGPLAEGEVLTLAAALAHADGDDYSATEYARRGLAVATRLHGYRPLLDGGEVFHGLLRDGIGRWGVHEALVGRVLERAAHPAAVTPFALTARELEVLLELPSLNTMEDIAQVLFVSINTVKTHLRSLYRKLEVTSRRGAVAEARRLGLI